MEEKKEVDEERVEIKQNIPIKWYDYNIILTDNILNTKSMEDFKEGNVTFLKFTEKCEDENYKIICKLHLVCTNIKMKNIWISVNFLQSLMMWQILFLLE